jgi:hypothetical protein
MYMSAVIRLDVRTSDICVLEKLRLLRREPLGRVHSLGKGVGTRACIG